MIDTTVIYQQKTLAVDPLLEDKIMFLKELLTQELTQYIRTDEFINVFGKSYLLPHAKTYFYLTKVLHENFINTFVNNYPWSNLSEEDLDNPLTFIHIYESFSSYVIKEQFIYNEENTELFLTIMLSLFLSTSRIAKFIKWITEYI
jgi:hypothetical protein